MKSVSSQNAAPETTGADSVPLPGDVTVPDAFRRRPRCGRVLHRAEDRPLLQRDDVTRDPVCIMKSSPRVSPAFAT
jgi:hypothetical protein